MREQSSRSARRDADPRPGRRTARLLPSLAAGLAGLLATLPAAAQPAPATWIGPAVVGVDVENDDGNPVVGAQVTLRFTAVSPPAGPPPVTTGADGRVVVGGLAEGSWYVEVRHPDHMSFTAYLETRAGKAAKSSG